MDTMAPGCCSAVSPCSHQKRDPSTICDVCNRAAETAAKETERLRKSERRLELLALAQRFTLEH